MTGMPNNAPTQETCVNCGYVLKEGAQFCGKCGTPIIKRQSKSFCHTCGTELMEGEQFCPKCGSATAQVRDQAVFNNIAAYNNAISMPMAKKAKHIAIKRLSVCAFIAWLLVTVGVGLLIAMMTFEYSYGGTMGSFHFATIYGIPIISFGASTILGTFLWKEEKKAKILPIILYSIGTISLLSGVVENVCGMRKAPPLLIAFCLAPLIIILTATKAIKSKKLAVTLTSMAIIVTLGVAVVNMPHLKILFCMFVVGVTLPLLLLTCSFTNKEEPEDPDQEKNEEKAKTVKKKEKKRKLIAIILAVVIFIGSPLVTVSLCFVRVDDMTNMTYTEVCEKYSRLSFTPVYEFSDTVEKGLIIGQGIEGGSFVNPYTSITVRVSKGAGVKVPDLANYSLKNATKKLQDLGLKVATQYEYSSTVAKNIVIKAVETAVDKGGTVTLKVSNGPDNRILPTDVTYLTESEAKKILKKQGFKVSVEYVYESCDAYYSASKVISQTPNEKLNKGETVKITVTKPSISISRVEFDHNSVGGVDIDINFKNTSDKTIKYVKFHTRYKNAVGDDVYCEIRNTSTMNLEYTGPLYSGSSAYGHWDAVIYNWTCDQVHFDKITVTFMDGSTHEMEYSAYWY